MGKEAGLLRGQADDPLVCRDEDAGIGIYEDEACLVGRTGVHGADDAGMVRTDQSGDGTEDGGLAGSGRAEENGPGVTEVEVDVEV